MLTEFSISDFGVVAESTLEIKPGLVALTGETGAGKTMIVSGLGHLLGGRADSGIVRRGSDKAVVRGRWRVDDAIAERVDELGGELDEGELTTIRQVSASGRSRAVVGGAPAPIAALASLELATIHGQSEQLRLSTPERQRELLDLEAKPAELDEYRAAYRERERLRQELSDLENHAQERAREADMLRFGLEEISKVEPLDGEDEALSIEQQRLLDLDELRQLAGHAQAALSGDEQDFDVPSAVSLMGEARKILSRLADRDAAASTLAERAAEASMLVDEVAADTASYLADLVDDPARLEHVAARRAALAGLTKKYGETIPEVLQWAREAGERLQSLDGSDDRISELRDCVGQLDAQLEDLATRISRQRTSAAASLAAAAEAELAALAMPHARLVFELTDVPLGPHGKDKVELKFAANPGSALAPLGKVASGGELSRVRLALEVILAGGAAGHTFVFDEVDAGVGGAVGLEIGRRLQRLAAHAQVIVVTHLAQVAAFADQHFVVSKSSDGEVTTSDVVEVTGEQRAAELARMMGGSSETDASLEHASELLREASRGR